MSTNPHRLLLTLEDRYNAVFNEKALRETIISYAVGARSGNYSSTDARKLCQVSSTWRKYVLAVLVKNRLPLFRLQVGDPEFSESWKNLFKSWGEGSLYQNRDGGPRNLPPFSAEIDERAFKDVKSNLGGFITALAAGGSRSLVEIKIVTPAQVVGGPQVPVFVPGLPSNLTFPALRCVTYEQEIRIWVFNQNGTFVDVDDVRLKDFFQFFLDQAPEVAQFINYGFVIPFRPSLFTFRLPPTIQDLRISSQHLPALSADLRAGRIFRDLKILHISNLELKDSQDDFLNILENCGRTLKELHLNCQQPVAGVTMNLPLAKFPVLEQLRKLDLRANVTWLPKDDFSVDLSSRFPKLEFLLFYGNGLNNLVDGFCHRDSRYPNMDYLKTSLKINLHQNDYYSMKPAPAEIVRCISTAFPNLSKMTLTVKDGHTSGLTNVFRYLTTLKHLKVGLFTSSGIDQKLDEAMWDALIIGTNVQKARDLRQEANLWLPWLAEAKEREEQGNWDFEEFAPSIRNLKNLKTFKFGYDKELRQLLYEQFGVRINAKFTYISFILGLKRVKTLEEVECGDEFEVTQEFTEMVEMYEKSEEGQKIRRLFGETVEVV